MHSWRLGALGIRLAVVLVGVALAAIATVAAVTLIIQKIDVSNLASSQHSQVEGVMISALENAYQARSSWSGADLQPAVVLAKMSGAAFELDGPDGTVLLRTGQKSLLAPSNTTLGRQPLLVLGQKAGVMQLGFPSLSPSNLRLRNELVQALGISAALALLAVLVATRFITPRLVRPIRRLTAAVRELGAGREYKKMGQEAGPGELGELGRAFDAMAGALKRNEQLRHTMVADVAHELRTPLAILMGETEALIDGVREPTIETLESLHEETHRLARMVEDLQTLASAEAAGLGLERQQVDLAQIAAGAADSFTGVFQDARIELKRCLSPAVVSADPERMRQIVGNLLTNAAKFTPAGGRVDLAVRADARSALLEVRDTGPGVPSEEQEQIFDRFFRGTAGRTTRGTGIGLAVVKELVQVHEGSVHLQSPPGGGACFVVRLPLSSNNQAP